MKPYLKTKQYTTKPTRKPNKQTREGIVESGEPGPVLQGKEEEEVLVRREVCSTWCHSSLDVPT